MKRTCKDCNKEFEITDGEIDFYKSKNFDLPKRCEECRDKNKKGKKSYVKSTSTKDTSNNNKINLSNLSKTADVENKINNINRVNQNTNKTNKSKKTAISIVACLVILISSYFGIEEIGLGSRDDSSQSTTYSSQEYSHEHEFTSEESWESHFEKHGDEFTYTTKEEYLDGANRVINSPDALQKEEAEDGDKIYYLEATNEIVFMAKNGEIRTYFKPSDGIDYFNRQ